MASDSNEPFDWKVREGTLLAAGPDMLDPNFMHRVVLLCRHTDEGAYGLVVNRAAELSTRDVFAGHPRLGLEGAPAFPVFLGGPVGLDTVQVLHRAPERIEGGIEVADGIHVGGELEDVARFVIDDEAGSRTRLRLVLGYAGWAAGQLEAELAEGAWLPARPEPELVFGQGGDQTWRLAVRSIGAPAEGLADLPPDPEWN